MKTKLISLFLALAASVGTIFANGYSIGYFYYLLDWDNETAEVTYESFNSNSNYADLWYLSLSDQIGYNGTIFTVNSIGVNAFLYSPISTLGIAESITSIKAYAFYDSGLTSIDIPNSVNYIGDAAFSHCMNLEVPLYNAKIFAALPVSHSGDYTIPEGINTIAGGAFDGCTGLTTITIPNSVTHIGNFAFRECINLTSVEMSNSVTTIGESAFEQCINLSAIEIPNTVQTIEMKAFCRCNSLSEVTLPKSVTSIGAFAFYWGGLKSITISENVRSIGAMAFGYDTLTSMTCLAIVPPTLEREVFTGVDCSSIPLYVPFESIDAYREAPQWADFDIKAIPAKETENSEVTATANDDNSVTIEWPVVEEAVIYTIEIKKDGEFVCTLEFNEEGQLISKEFAILSHNGNRQTKSATQTAKGWQYTIDGLDSNTEYTYTITAKKADDSVAFTQTITFSTLSHEAIETIETNGGNMTKILHNGQIYIRRGDKTYTLQGQEVK